MTTDPGPGMVAVRARRRLSRFGCFRALAALAGGSTICGQHALRPWALLSTQCRRPVRGRGRDSDLDRTPGGSGVTQCSLRPCMAELPRSLPWSADPERTASAHASVVATAARLELRTAMSVSWTCCAATDPASLAMEIAPVASES